jgi:hypothetical protein
MPITTGTLQTVRYFPVLLPDGLVLPTLPAGGVQPLVALDRLETLTPTPRIARLRRLRMPAIAGVQIALTADSYALAPVDSGALMQAPVAAGWTHDPWDVGAASRLTATVLTGPGSANPWWATWLIEATAVDAAQSMLFPGVWPQPPTAAAAAAQAVNLADPLTTSQAPLGLATQIRRLYRSHIRRSVMTGHTLALAVGQPTLMAQEVRTTTDEMLVLAGLSTSAGTGTDQLALTIGIDGTDSFYTVAAYPLAQVGLVPCFVQAQHTITIYATTQTAETVAVAAEIWHVARTPVINARLQQAVATAVTDAVEAGTL